MEQFSTPIKFLFTRRLNQDALENFFGVIRTQHGNAYNPTPIQFYFSFKKLFRINYCQINTGNCEIDQDEILTKCTNFNEKDIVEIQTVFNESSVNMEIDDYEYRNWPVNEENAFMYICGYLLKCCFIKHRCETCESFLLDNNNNLNSLQFYNYFKAYNSTENDIYGKLYIPTSVFVSYIKEMHIKFFENFKIICQSNVIQKFICILSEIEFPNTCSNFPKNYLIKFFIRVRLYYTLKFINRDLKNRKDTIKKLQFCSINNKYDKCYKC